MNYKTSKKKEKLIQQALDRPIEVGDFVYVQEQYLSDYARNKERTSYCEVVGFSGDKVSVKEASYQHAKPKDVDVENIIKYTGHAGANPFIEERFRIRPVAFTLESVLHSIDAFNDKEFFRKPYLISNVEVKELNWNPFVYVDGEKKYYQRDFCWTLKQKKLLIESIYNYVDCGKLLIRLRGFKELRAMEAAGEKELAFREIVDGKQRLNAVISFMNDEYKDIHGNYYSDLSSVSQHKFTKHQLFSYSEMSEGTQDADILVQFLRLNHAGVPQSEEHLNFVRSLIK